MPELTEEQRQAWEEKLKKMSPEELREFQKQQCIFCQIVAGKVPSKKIFEDEKCLAVLDINPAVKGHLLLVPKEHYAIMPQIPEKEMGHLFLVSKYLSQVLLRVLRTNGTSLFIANGLAAGQRAQHFMIHLIPRKDGDGVLEVEEKLLGEGMPRKVKLAVEKKLNELLGIKKEVVLEKDEKKEKKEEKERTERGIREPPGEDKPEIEPPKIEPERPPKKGKGKKKAEPESPEAKSEEGVSLDEIASLFK